MMKVLSPGMEHRQKVELGARVLGVSANLQQGFGRGPEQNARKLSAGFEGLAQRSAGSVKTT
jgi:hypothetical protein